MNFSKITKIFFFAILSVAIISCSDDDNGNDPTPEDYELNQTDLNNATTVIETDITGAPYGDASVGHAGGPAPDETLRDVFANESKSDEIKVGSIITKKVYEKNEDGSQGKLLVTFAMAKRKDGYYPEGGDWEYFQMPNKGNTDYDENPNGLISEAAATGKIEMCAGCHAKAESNFVFTK